MPRATPTLGYPSKTAAIIALFDAGKNTSEIAQLVDQTEASVSGTISAERAARRRRGLATLHYHHAMRIMPKVYEVVAKAIGCTPDALHQAMKTATMNFPASAEADPEPAAPDPQESAAAIVETPDLAGQPSPATVTTSDVAGEELTKTVDRPNLVDGLNAPKFEETKPVLQMNPASQAMWDEKVSSGLVTLKDVETGHYLNLDGSGVTTDRRYIYRGTPAQARTMRDKNPIAKRMSFRTFLQPKP